MARPRKHDRGDLVEKLNAYVDKADIPILAEFCYQNDVRREYIYQMAETDEALSYAIKRCIEKKEAQLEIKSLKGEVNSTQAIFSLKQLGWRDRQELEHSGGLQINLEGSVKEWAK